MKIAFFTDTYHPSVDGVVRSIDAYATRLRSLGHEVRVYAPMPKDRRMKVSGAFYCPSFEFPPYPQYRVPYFWGKCVDDAVAFKPDIIHCHAMALMAIAAKKTAKKSGVPLVGTFHTMIPKAGHYISEIQGVKLWFENISWKYLQWLYSDEFDIILCPSQYVRKKVLEYKIEADVLPNPVDVKKFSDKKIDARAKTWFSKKTILFLGRVAKEKNIDFLLDVARLEEFDSLDAQILIAGDGPYKKELEKKVKKYSLEGKVLFSGRVDEALLPSFYALAQCTVFPSLFETQGLTALESLACSTPVVAFDKTAVSEIIEHGKNGYLAPQNAREALNVIAQAIEHKKKMGAHARKTAMEYTIEKCTEKLLIEYKKLLKTK